MMMTTIMMIMITWTELWLTIIAFTTSKNSRLTWRPITNDDNRMENNVKTDSLQLNIIWWYKLWYEHGLCYKIYRVTTLLTIKRGHLLCYWFSQSDRHFSCCCWLRFHFDLADLVWVIVLKLSAATELKKVAKSRWIFSIFLKSAVFTALSMSAIAASSRAYTV